MNNKVLLAAIAKDEAAYLPDWIFHHKYFGFDEIAIYVNNTSDPTSELKSALKTLPGVTFHKGDWYFSRFYNAPQIAIYRKVIAMARKKGFTHILFLDIDEFWTPLDFTTSIKDYIESYKADVVSFEWLMKNDEVSPFSAPFGGKNQCERARHVKSLFRTDLTITDINPHNVTAVNADYRLADGSPWPSLFDSNFRVPKIREMHSIPHYFILHRFCRSQIEYISLLGRGRPTKTGSIFKDNRNGYPAKSGPLEFTISDNSLSAYLNERSQFYNQYKLEKIISNAKAFILNRYQTVLATVESAPFREAPVLAKVLRDVTDSGILNAYKKFCQTYGIPLGTQSEKAELSSEDFLVLRKAAFVLAEGNPQLALSLLMILKKTKPEGKVINSKIKELKRRLNIR
ncbi:glycosyltransferase family 2 protein [Alteromonas sp. C1M14]|uniref:glycosyltransferase family 2 protein n=1 Tax=Alteromonas sp. C1M14 TaxID=2841567 RepID=UPI001C095708|nr:glycosyltransferase family 2 protein [Alteromonas sp. C1M14]MBU2977228.1 glycosyltransferase family 2 protein [Alteromonas sp. C1M14]